jgi:hypothetical protein
MTERPDRNPHAARGVNIRALLRDREFIKVTAFLLPHRTKMHVLEMMERLRQERIPRRRKALAGPEVRLPEMTGGELVREINWRIGTLPPRDAEQLVQYIRRLTRWRAARTRERSQRREAPSPSIPSKTIR